jgi:type I restriction enzyme, R subunit
MFVHKEISDVLLHEDLKQFLLNKYGDEDITFNEINSIIRKLELYPSSAFMKAIKPS